LRLATQCKITLLTTRTWRSALDVAASCIVLKNVRWDRRRRITIQHVSGLKRVITDWLLVMRRLLIGKQGTNYTASCQRSKILLKLIASFRKRGHSRFRSAFFLGYMGIWAWWDFCNILLEPISRLCFCTNDSRNSYVWPKCRCTSDEWGLNICVVARYSTFSTTQHLRDLCLSAYRPCIWSKLQWVPHQHRPRPPLSDFLL